MAQRFDSTAKKISKRIMIPYDLESHLKNPMKDDFFNLAFKKNLLVFHERPFLKKLTPLITG